VTWSGGVPVTSSWSAWEKNPKILVADLQVPNVTNGPSMRLFVDEAPMVWARYPNIPAGVPGG
jgi:hypothetical protein